LSDHKAYLPALLISTLFFLLAAIYSIITPLFESPDEVWHYPFVWHLAREWSLPLQDPANPQLWQQEGSQPPLYYWLAALLTAPLSTDDLPDLIYRNPHADIGVVRPDGNANIIIHTAREQWPWSGAVLAVHLVRLFSGLLGSGTVLLTYGLGRLLWPEKPAFALVAMAFVAFNPMFIFISASVNNDNLITFLATLTLLWLVKLGLREGQPAWWHFVGLGLMLGAAALAKVSGLGLVGLSGLTLLLWGVYRRSWWWAVGGNVIISLLVAAIAGWWYWRNFQLYGDWSGTTAMITMMGPRSTQPTPGQFLAESSGLVRSFWGLFGYFNVPLPSVIYQGLNLIFGLGLVGLLVRLIRPVPPSSAPGGRDKNIFTWLILLGWLVILLLGFVQWTLRTPATQGRLLFPALSVVALIWAWGWLALASDRLMALPGLVMLGVALWVPWGVIGPAYSRPASIPSLPAVAQPLEATFGRSIQLLGYRQDQAVVRPGETLTLTLYWRGVEPIPTDYTVFVHVLDAQDLIVAQRNLFPGGGLYPTRQWLVGQIFADRYSLQLPSTAYAPSQARFEVGLYDHTTGQRLPVSSGASGGDNMRFGQIKIEPLLGSGQPNPQQLLFEDHIELIGYALDRRQARAGDSLTVTLYWRAEAVPSQNYKVFVHLVGEGEQRAAQHDSDPQNGAAPTTSWLPGQTVVDAHPLTIAPDTPPGTYQLRVGLYDGPTGQRLRLLQDGDGSVQADSITLPGVRVSGDGE
jgi:4-amino-4-deoxy-L-arabinose transferase-like glycosyltransferase